MLPHVDCHWHWITVSSVIDISFQFFITCYIAVVECFLNRQIGVLYTNDAEWYYKCGFVCFIIFLHIIKIFNGARCETIECTQFIYLCSGVLQLFLCACIRYIKPLIEMNFRKWKKWNQIGDIQSLKEGGKERMIRNLGRNLGLDDRNMQGMQT